MGPIIIEIDPVVLRVGHFSVQWYGVAILAAIVAGFYVALRVAKLKGIPEDDISFWRQEVLFLFGLQEAQVVSLATMAFAAFVAVTLLSRARTQRLSVLE